MEERLIDPFAREITYLRISVTDRCDFRCVYCMAENMTFLPKKELLSLEELAFVCNAFIDLGVEKIRVTGGEPLVRRDIMEFFKMMGQRLGHGLNELTLTTNASQLEKYASQLRDYGVERVNVSLDTLNADKFHKITRWGRLDQVLRGVQAAKDAGLKVKINTVALKGTNEDELFDLVNWCGEEGFDLTFIEVMPMGDLGGEDRLDQFWPLTELRTRIAERYSIMDTTDRTGGPARYVRLSETGQRIGFISPLTQNFCDGCNRVRLTCTGSLYQCLGQTDQMDLRDVARAHPGDVEPLYAAIRKAIGLKPKGHDFDYSGDTIGGQMPRHMSHTGG